MNLCRSCKRDFATPESFDDHRVGTHDYTFAEGLYHDPPVEDGRRCLDPDDMTLRGWRLDRYGRWLSPIEHPILERVQL